MDLLQKQHLADRIAGEYSLKGDVLIKEDKEIELEAFRRTYPKKGQPKCYLTLKDFKSEPLMVWKDPLSEEEPRVYISGLFPTRGKRNTYTFDIEKNYFELVLKNAEQAEIKRATKEKALIFRGGENG